MGAVRLAVTSAISISAASAGFADVVVYSASGSDAEVTHVLDQFRADLGALNPNTPGSLGAGRREINWDGVPDSASAPNAFPGDFFNASAAGRARGTVFATPGSGFQLSADSDNPTGTPINFANLNPQYAGLFRAFSPARMFTAIGSTTTVVNFFVPGSSTPATVSGFGAIFSDVDAEASTEMLYYDVDGRLLATVYVPIETELNGGASFAGVRFESGAPIARVIILSGVVRLGPGANEGPSSGDVFDDAVVMDDFVYGEPIATTSTCFGRGDVDGDGQIGLGDLASLLTSFGLCVPLQGFDEGADLNGNGCIDLGDLSILLTNFGTSCR